MSYDSDHVSIVITKTLPPKESGMRVRTHYVASSSTAVTAEPENWGWDDWDDNGRRWQPYHWAAITPNGRTLAVASERYTNRADIVDAILLLFSGKVPVRIVDGEETFEIAARADADRWVWRIVDQVPNGHAEAADDCDPDYPATEVQG